MGGTARPTTRLTTHTTHVNQTHTPTDHPLTNHDTPKKIHTGYFGPKEDPSRRLAWALMYYKERPEDNTYARPVEGVRVVVDLLKQ
jgi:Cu2+-containing amine oxidase